MTQLKIRKTIEALGNPETYLNNLFYITGTTGKTSIGIYISSILQEAGYTVNIYTSGNIYPNNNRININGKPLDDNSISSFIAETQSVLNKNNIICNQEEILFLSALCAFKEFPADVNIVEASYGGINDPTNIFQKNRPIINIISTVHTDHTVKNGNTPELNAIAQSATLYENAIIVSSRQSDSIENFFSKLAQTHKCKYYAIDKNYWIEREEHNNQNNIGFSFSNEWKSIFFDNINDNLLDYQLDNIATAIMAIDESSTILNKVNDNAIKLGIKNAKIFGQMQEYNTKNLPQNLRNTQIFINLATNKIGAKQIIPFIKKLHNSGEIYRKNYIIFSADTEYNIYGILSTIKPILSKLIIIDNKKTLNYIKSDNIQKIATMANIANITISNSLKNAIIQIAEQDETARIIVTGCASLGYDMQQLLENEKYRQLQ